MEKGGGPALTAAMTAGLTACGGGGNSTSADGKKRYFKADYLSDLPDSFNDTTSDIQFKGDVMYYTSSNEDYTKSGLYSYNLITGENAQLYEQAQSDGSGNSSWVSGYTVADSGEVYLFVTKNQMDESSVTEDYSDATLDDVLSYMADQWGYSAEDAEKDWNDYYAKDYTDENGNVNYGRFCWLRMRDSFRPLPFSKWTHPEILRLNRTWISEQMQRM